MARFAARSWKINLLVALPLLVTSLLDGGLHSHGPIAVRADRCQAGAPVLSLDHGKQPRAGDCIACQWLLHGASRISPSQIASPLSPSPDTIASAPPAPPFQPAEAQSTRAPPQA